ncbi:MAG: ATP-binding protein [Halanaerobiaceae bacterium]
MDKTGKIIHRAFEKLDFLLVFTEINKEQTVQKLRQMVPDTVAEDYEVTDKNLKMLLAVYSQLLAFSERYSLSGSPWKNYLCHLLAEAENVFTLTAERRGLAEESIYTAAARDLEILKEIYDVKLPEIFARVGIDDKYLIPDYTPAGTGINRFYAQRIKRLKEIFSRAESGREIVSQLAEFYHWHGAGRLNRYSAFRWSGGQMEGIPATDPITFNELIGYESQQKKLIENTEVFLAGNPANNILLYGSEGTGKSSSIKALLNRYSGEGLRLIEVGRHQIKELPEILQTVAGRGLKFIIFMDDLSFEDFETDYKYLKAVMEGGIERKPDNLLFYATSNRRHLVRETWSDREEGGEEVHISDTTEEKLSFVSRFGITISFSPPTRDEYLEIVTRLADIHGINISRETLEERAGRWAMWQNGYSGRTAVQFINQLLGEL